VPIIAEPEYATILYLAAPAILAIEGSERETVLIVMYRLEAPKR
jgi:hypothetical protein